MSAPRETGVSDVVILVVLAGAVAAASAVWVWGGIAGAVFGGGWPRMSPDALLDVLVRLPGHVSDPAAAWPRRLRAALPGPIGFYAALAIVVVLLAAVTTVAARTWGRSRGAARRRSAGARWAGGDDLRVLRRGAGARRPRSARMPADTRSQSRATAAR